jgi:orotate phosphoribosyltransferase-like protein
MKDQETRGRFIELRAQGLSFDKISKELQVSKQTLIDMGGQN